MSSGSRPRVEGGDLLPELGDRGPAARPRRSGSRRRPAPARSASSSRSALAPRQPPRSRARRQPRPPRRRAASASRSARGTFASTNTSCTSCVRPGEAVAGPPRAHVEPRLVGARSSTGPKRTRAVLERDAVVLANGADAAAEVGVLRAVAGREQTPGACARACAAGAAARRRARAGSGGARGCEPPSSGRISFRIRPRFVSGSSSPCGRRARRRAVGLGLLAPDGEQRADDAVLALSA